MTKHVLVVDDEPAMLTLLTRVLSAMRYRVSAAPDGPAALALLASEPIDLVVTDYRMPGMNGRELIALLRATRPDLKALVVTGHPPTAADADEWIVQPCLLKPFSVGLLRQAVTQLIGPP